MPEHALLRDVHLRGSAQVPTVALTFDDGPNGACTAGVLDALRSAGAPATFFLLGAHVARGTADALLARMVREGHEIGVHGWAHGIRRLFWSDLTATDLARTVAAITGALARQGLPPSPLRFFRPPYGFLIGPAARAAHSAQMAVVEWTVSVEDWRNTRTAAELTGDLVDTLRAGDVVVLHDGNRMQQDSDERCLDRPLAAAVVHDLVPGLAARGLRVAPLADVLGMTPRDAIAVDSATPSP